MHCPQAARMQINKRQHCEVHFVMKIDSGSHKKLFSGMKAHFARVCRGARGWAGWAVCHARSPHKYESTYARQKRIYEAAQP